MTVRVKVELWLWLGKELAGDFRSPSEMRSILETDVQDGSTVRSLFEDLAHRYQAIDTRVFANHGFAQGVVVTMNDRSINAAQVCDRVLEDGDKIVVLPMYAGG